MRGTRVLHKNYNFPSPLSKLELSRLSRSLGLFRNRALLAEDSTAKQITEILGPDPWKGRTVVELFPGPGTLTKQMILNGAVGVIPLEPAEVFHPRLREMAACCDVPFLLEHSEHLRGDKFFSMIKGAPSEFRTKIPLPTHPWNQVHPKMIITSLTSCINTCFRLSRLLIYSIYHKRGWFKYGRLPLIMISPPELLKVKLIWCWTLYLREL